MTVSLAPAASAPAAAAFAAAAFAAALPAAAAPPAAAAFAAALPSAVLPAAAPPPTPGPGADAVRTMIDIINSVFAFIVSVNNQYLLLTETQIASQMSIKSLIRLNIGS